MKKLRIFGNILKTGFAGVWKHRSMGFASIISITAVSVIVGIVLIVALTMNTMLSEVQTRVNEMEVYLSDEMTDETVAQLGDDLKAMAGVSSVRFKTKEEALAEMKEVWEEDAYILEGVESNIPLPRSYVVELAEIGEADNVSQFAQSVEGVDKVVYYNEAVERLVKLSDYIQLGGLVAVVALLIISVFVISNTVKLTVMARRKEISVMKYVGASNSVISGPFIIEGIIFGLMGSALAFFVVYYGYRLFYERFNDNIYLLIASYLIEPGYLKTDLLIIFMALGVGIGTVGSVFSLKRYLRV